MIFTAEKFISYILRYRVLFILAVIKFILPFTLQHSIYELHRDELLYIEQGHHLAWGYMEVPPVLSILAWLTHLFGGTFFWVKFWPSLFGAATVFVAGRIAQEMGGRTFAQFLAGLCVITGAYLRVNYLFQPVFLEVFFWTLSAWYVTRYANTQHIKYIYLLALSLALGWYTKYSVSFFIVGLFAGLLLTPNRKLFTNKHLYAASVIVILVVLPNLLWQYTHRWPVVHHMKELRETQLRFVSPSDFLKNQFLMNLACTFIWLPGLVWLFLKPGRKYRVIAWTYLGILAVLLITSGKDYYTLGAYPMLFAAGGVCIERITMERRLLRYAVTLVTILLFIPLIPMSLPVWKPERLSAYYHKSGLDKSGALKWEDLQQHALPQDFADMLSWKEMAGKVSAAYAALPDTTKEKTTIICSNYGEAGAVTFYGQSLPQVLSPNASFLLWMPDQFNTRNLLFVTEDVPENIIFRQFEKHTILDSITNPFAREAGVKIILFENGNQKVSGMIEQYVKGKKDEFRR